MRKLKGFIVDIDGTVADHTDLRGHYEYAKVSGDRPIKSNIIVIKTVIQHSGIDPIFVTGRADENNNQVRLDTVAWLREHVTDMPFNLFMRPEFQGVVKKGRYERQRDFRPDYIIKEEILDKFIIPKWGLPEFAFDDRLQVCQMWHRRGIPVIRVGDPDANF